MRARLASSLRQAGVALRGPAIGVALSLLVCSALLLSLVESPAVLFEAIWASLGTSFGLGYTLFYATPLIFTGLSVAVCFHCGLFNIGAEGQLYLGSVALICVATWLGPLPAWLAIPMGILAAMAGGALWGSIAGWLKAKRGSHEVIVTILLNFIGISLVNWIILYPMRNLEVQNTETVVVPQGYALHTLSHWLGRLGLSLFESTPVNTSLFIAVGFAVAMHCLLFHTTMGFELRAVGQSPRSARFSGISVARNTWFALMLGGAMAGLVGVNEVMGHQHKLVEGFSPQYGFTGIAVALLARNNPIGIVASAILFGLFQNSAREIEFLSERVSKEVSLVLQGTLIAFVAASALFESWAKRLKLGVRIKREEPA